MTPMDKIYKFYPPTFDPQRYWEDRRAREHIAGKSSEAFRKQGFWPLLQQQLSKDKRYLDAGCGIGGWILFLKEEGYQIEGIDQAARTVRALTEYDPDLKVQVAAITALPYPDQSLDGVIAIGSLEYAENEVAKALDEVRRVLRPGGVFFLEVPLANSLRQIFYIPIKRWQYWWRTSRGDKPTFAYYLFTRSNLSELLQQAGFEIQETQPHELPEADGHYGLYTDWSFLRGREPYHLNALGRLVKSICNPLSPWVASTGMVIVARSKK